MHTRFFINEKKYDLTKKFLSKNLNISFEHYRDSIKIISHSKHYDQEKKRNKKIANAITFNRISTKNVEMFLVFLNNFISCDGKSDYRLVMVIF